MDLMFALLDENLYGAEGLSAASFFKSCFPWWKKRSCLKRFPDGLTAFFTL